ncbi:uncharacterized protein NPIL_273721, partial [Nephila pilipes]
MVVTLAVSHKSDNVTQTENDQEIDATTKATPEMFTFETQDDGKDLEYFTERIADFTDRAHRFQKPKVEYAEPQASGMIKNSTYSSLPADHAHFKLKIPDTDIKNKKFNSSGDGIKALQTDETDSLETLPSEHVRIADSISQWDYKSSTVIQQPKSRNNDENEKLVSSNQTEVETRPLGIWKLPAKFIGFDISNHQSLNVVKPAAIVESRSFITKPEISNTRLNYVVPQAIPKDKSDKQAVPEKNNLRRQQYSEENYSSAENSAENPSSGVYTETQHDFGKLLDADYRSQIEKAAEELIKKQREENKTSTDSSKAPHRPQPIRYEQNEMYGKDQNSFHTPHQQNNPYNNGHREPQIYSEPQNEYSNENREPQIYSEPQNEYSNENREPQIYSEPQNAYHENREPQIYSEPQNAYHENREPQIYSKPENEHYNNREPQVHSQHENEYNNRNKPPHTPPRPGNEHDVENKSPDAYNQQPIDSFFVFKGFEALFPGLFGNNMKPNSPSINEHKSANLPTTIETDQSPNYKTKPLHFKEEHPEKYSDIQNHPPQNAEHNPQLPLRNYKQVSRPTSEEQYRKLPPQSEEYQEYKPFEEQRPESLPVYKEHYQRPLRNNDEQYGEQPSHNKEYHGRWRPVKEEYRKVQPNNENLNSAIRYPPRQHIPLEPNQYNSDSSEEDTDCSLEQTDVDETPKLVRGHLPREPVPPQKLNVNHPVVRKNNHNSFHPSKPQTFHSYNNNPDSYEEHLPQSPVSEHGNINNPRPQVNTYNQLPISAETDVEENGSPETYQYERKHKYHVTVFKHDESSYQKHTPNAPYQHTPNAPFEHTPNAPYQHTPKAPFEHTPNAPYQHTPKAP